MSSHSNYKNTVYVLAGVCMIWGVLGLMDVKNLTWSGYSTDNNTVTEVEEGSPAALAGMQVGDVIVSIGEISVNDTKALGKRNRAEIGESRAFVVERDGVEQSFDVVYASQNSKDQILTWLGIVIGFIFVFFGARAYIKNPGTATLMFALFGLFFGFSFMNGPYFESPVLRRLVTAIALPIIVLSFAALLHFMLTYPRPRDFLANKNKLRLLYAPAIVLSLIFLFLIIVQPDGSNALGTFMNIIIGLFILFYFGWSLIAMLQNYNRASADDRIAYGLNLMLWGTVISLVPLLLQVIITTVSPKTIVPGNDYLFLLFALIPIAFGLALDKGGSAHSAVAEVSDLDLD